MRSGRFSDTISVCFLIFCWVQQITNVDFDIDRTIRQHRSNGSFPDRERQASATEEIQNPKPHTASQPHLGTSSVGTRSGGKRLLSLGKTSFSQFPSSSSQKDAAKQASAVEMRVLSQDEQSRERASRSMRKSLDRMCFPGFVGTVKLCLLLVGSAGTEVSPFPTPTLSPQAEWWRSQLGQPGFGEWKRVCRGGQRKGQKQSSCCAFTYTNATSCEQAADCLAQDIRDSFRSRFQLLTALVAHLSDKEDVPAPLQGMLEVYKESHARVAGKALHQMVARQTEARTALQKLQKNRQGFLDAWADYVASVSELFSTQLGEMEDTMTQFEFAAAEEAWQTQLQVDESTCPLNRRGSRDQNHGRDGRGRSHGCSGSGRSRPKASATGEGREYDGACNKSLQLKRVHSAWQTEPQSILGPPTCVSSFKGLGKCVSFQDEGEEALQARRSKIRRIRSARTAAQPLSVLPAIGGGSLSSSTAEGWTEHLCWYSGALLQSL